MTCAVCGFGMHLELVAGVGVAALVPRLARPPIPAAWPMAATDPVMRRSIDAVWRTDRESPAVRAAVAALTAVARERVGGQASGASSCRRRSRCGAGVAGRAGLVDEHQQRVAVAVEAHLVRPAARVRRSPP